VLIAACANKAAASFANLVGGVHTFNCHKLPELHMVPLVHLYSNQTVKQPSAVLAATCWPKKNRMHTMIK
jgi:hypothetical protein